MKRTTRRLVLLAALAVAPAFLDGCILTDLLGGLGGAGGAGGLGGLLGGGGPQPGIAGAKPASKPVVPFTGTPNPGVGPAKPGAV